MNRRNKVFEKEKHKTFLEKTVNSRISKQSPLDTQVNSIYIHGVYWAVCCFKLLKCEIHDEFPNLQIVKDIVEKCESINDSTSPILMGYSINPFENLSPTILSTLSGIQINVLLGKELSENIRIKIMNFITNNLKFGNSSEVFFSNSSFQNNQFDIRFIYSALSSIYLLNAQNIKGIQWKIPILEILNTLKILQNVDGGFGRRPRDESHAGYTFCAVASIALIKRLETDIDISGINYNRLERWLLKRIIFPEDHEITNDESLCFNGRVGKKCDVCYSWWVVASIKIIESMNVGICKIFSSKNYNIFIKIIFGIISHQNEDGGFQKTPFKAVNFENTADLLHTFLSISTLSLLINHLISRKEPEILMILESVGLYDSISEIDPITVLPLKPFKENLM